VLHSPPRLVITGRPGSGKSTLFRRIVDKLRDAGYTVGGISSPEVRVGGKRIGFKIIDLLTNEERWLAKRGYISRARVGSYGVLLKEATELWKKALSRALKADVIGIDEVGPMELKIPGFKYDLVNKVLTSPKPLILVIHYRLDPRSIGLLASKIITVTLENRERLNKELPKNFLMEVNKYYGRLQNP